MLGSGDGSTATIQRKMRGTQASRLVKAPVSGARRRIQISDLPRTGYVTLHKGLNLSERQCPHS